MALGTVNVSTKAGGSVTADDSTHLTMEEVLGEGPYTIEFTDNPDPEDIRASLVYYDNAESGLAAKNLQEAVDEMAEGKVSKDLSNLDDEIFAQKAKEVGVGGAAIYYATIGTTWTEDSTTGVKSQTVAIEGVTAEHTSNMDACYTGDGTSDSYATYVEQQNQFLERITNGYAETVDGGIKFVIFGTPNTVSIPIIVEVI